MANYATLKAAIQNVIKTNGNNEITGALLQQSLLSMINSLGGYYQFAGIATPSTNPGTPDQNVFYLASTAGTYTNFGGIVLAENEAAILKYNGSWVKESSGFATSEIVSKLTSEVMGITRTGATAYVFDVQPGDYFIARSETKFLIYTGASTDSLTYYGERPDNLFNAFIYRVPTGVYKIRLYKSQSFTVNVSKNEYYYAFIDNILGLDSRLVNEVEGVTKSGAGTYNMDVQPGDYFIAIAPENFAVYSGPNDANMSFVGRKSDNPLNAFVYNVPSGIYRVKLYYESNFTPTVITNWLYYSFIETINNLNNAIVNFGTKKVTPFDFYGVPGPSNLLYPAVSVSGYLDSGGQVRAGSNYKTGDFIEITPSTQYALSYIRFSLQYNGNKQVISATYTDHNNAASAIITTNANAKYLRVTYLVTNENAAQVAVGSTVPQYSDYSALVPFIKIPFANVENVAVDLSEIKDGIKSTNLFNKNDVVSGYLNSQGSITANDSYRTTNLIPVIPQQVYSLSYARFVAQYDSVGKFISNSYADKNNAQSTTITTVATAAYIRVTFATGFLYNGQINLGSTLGPYEDFGYRFNALRVPKSKFDGKKMVCFGDSITGSVWEQEQNNWCMYVKNATGIETINQGYWSGRLAHTTHTDAVRNSFSFCALVDSIISGDWSAQDIVYQTSGYELHAQQLDKLKQIDFTQIDFLSIAYGTNDLASDTPFEIENEPMSKDSINGAFRYTISQLLSNFPKLQILIMTPIYRFDPATGDDYMYNGRGIQSFVDDYFTIGAELRIPVCNMFNEIGVNKYNRVYYWGANGGDGLHPIATMKRVMGNKVAGFLLSVY